MKRLLLAFLLISVTQTYVFAQKTQPPQVQTPSIFRGDTATQPDRQSLADLKWFELFKDPKLQQLISDALTYNYDVREAVARIDAARATVGIVRSEQFPNIYATGDVINQRNSRSGAVDIPAPIKRERSFGDILLNLLNFE